MFKRPGTEASLGPEAEKLLGIPFDTEHVSRIWLTKGRELPSLTSSCHWGPMSELAQILKPGQEPETQATEAHF